MGKTISVGQLRQNPTAMLREVRAGATYTVTDHGEPVAEISPQRTSRWVASEVVNELLAELGADETWSHDLAEARSAVDVRDPWEERTR